MYWATRSRPSDFCITGQDFSHPRPSHILAVVDHHPEAHTWSTVWRTLCRRSIALTDNTRGLCEDKIAGAGIVHLHVSKRRASFNQLEHPRIAQLLAVTHRQMLKTIFTRSLCKILKGGI